MSNDIHRSAVMGLGAPPEGGDRRAPQALAFRRGSPRAGRQQRRPLIPPGLSRESLATQRLACLYLVRGCERALYELRCSLGQAVSPADIRSGLGAAAVLEGVLLSWRDALAALNVAADGSDAQAPLPPQTQPDHRL
jgi:hypothetical protein